MSRTSPTRSGLMTVAELMPVGHRVSCTMMPSRTVVMLEALMPAKVVPSRPKVASVAFSTPDNTLISCSTLLPTIGRSDTRC